MDRQRVGWILTEHLLQMHRPKGHDHLLSADVFSGVNAGEDFACFRYAASVRQPHFYFQVFIRVSQSGMFFILDALIKPERFVRNYSSDALKCFVT